MTAIHSSSRSTSNDCPWFPPVDVLRRLAISESGFVFDPVSGQSFSAGETGVQVLKAVCETPSTTALLDRLCCEYAASATEIERDIIEFGSRLKEILK